MTNSDIVRFLINKGYKLERITWEEGVVSTLHDITLSPTGRVNVQPDGFWDWGHINTWGDLKHKICITYKHKSYYALDWTYSKFLWLVLRKGASI